MLHIYTELSYIDALIVPFSTGVVKLYNGKITQNLMRDIHLPNCVLCYM